MTEAGQKWFIDNCQSEASQTVGWISNQQAEFWMRTFCDEVIIRAVAKCRHQCPPCSQCQSTVLNELKRELLDL